MIKIHSFKRKSIHKVILILFGASLLFMLSSCSPPESEPLSFQPTPERTIEIKMTPPPTAAATPKTTTAILSSKRSSEVVPPEIVGNLGSNIENGGQALLSKSYVYYADDGLYRFEAYGGESKAILDMHNIAYLNDGGDYIYFVSTNEYEILRLHKPSGEVESLGITGAYSLLTLGDHLYYQYAIGEYADNHMYRARLDGSEVTDLGFAATHFCPHDIYIYFSNLDDQGHLYKYDIISGEIIKVRSDAAHQINVVNNRMYYIDQNDGNQIIAINLTGAGRQVIVEDACTSLNHVNDQLVFTRESSNHLELLNLEDHTFTVLLDYPGINGINTAEDWIFFEAPVVPGSYNAIFRVHEDGEIIIPPLPEVNLIRVVDVDFKNKTITGDYVEYLKGEEAVKGYAEDKGLSLEKAKERMEKENLSAYVRNRNPKLRTFIVHDFTAVQLVSRSDGTIDHGGYITCSDELFQLLESNPSLINQMLLTAVTMGDDFISIEEFYTPESE